MPNVKTFSLFMLLTVLGANLSLISCINAETPNTETEEQTTKPTQANKFDFSHIEGKNYYLLEKDFTCRANTTEKPLLKSWKNRIEFSKDEVLIWETVCNDNPIIKPFSSEDFSFSEDFSSLEYQSETYLFYAEQPKLCPQGQWCPIEE